MHLNFMFLRPSLHGTGFAWSRVVFGHRKCQSHTCRGTIQFDIVTMCIRYRVNGV